MIRIDLVDADVRVLTIVQILPPWKDNFRLKDFCGLIGYDSEIRILIFRFTELQKLQANCAMFRKCTCVSGRCLANLQPFLQVCIAIILIPLQWLRQWIISCMLLSHFWWDQWTTLKYTRIWHVEGKIHVEKGIGTYWMDLWFGVRDTSTKVQLILVYNFLSKTWTLTMCTAGSHPMKWWNRYKYFKFIYLRWSLKI